VATDCVPQGQQGQGIGLCRPPRLRIDAVDESADGTSPEIKILSVWDLDWDPDQRPENDLVVLHGGGQTGVENYLGLAPNTLGFKLTGCLSEFWRLQSSTNRHWQPPTDPPVCPWPEPTIPTTTSTTTTTVP
jgi:hypothetical protein